MGKTLHIPIDDELYGMLVEQSKSKRFTKAAYCRSILLEAALAAIPKPKPEPKTPGRKAAPETFERKMAREARERKHHSGRTIDENVEYWMKVLQDPKDINNDVAAGNLEIYKGYQRERDISLGIPPKDYRQNNSGIPNAELEALLRELDE